VRTSGSVGSGAGRGIVQSLGVDLLTGSLGNLPKVLLDAFIGGEAALIGGEGKGAAIGVENRPFVGGPLETKPLDRGLGSVLREKAAYVSLSPQADTLGERHDGQVVRGTLLRSKKTVRRQFEYLAAETERNTRWKSRARFPEEPATGHPVVLAIEDKQVPLLRGLLASLAVEFDGNGREEVVNAVEDEGLKQVHTPVGVQVMDFRLGGGLNGHG